MAGTADWTNTGRKGNLWIDKLTAGTQWNSPGSITVISAYIAGLNGNERLTGDKSWPITASEVLEKEVAAFGKAMQLYEAVCNVDFRLAPNIAGADIIWASTGNEANDFDGDGEEEPALGWADLPGSVYNSAVKDEQSVISINWEAYDTGTEPAFEHPSLLRSGTYDFITVIHELGHALGLDHPHTGGEGDGPFPGVSPGDDQDIGRYGMNQGIWTTMSYADGWRTAPHGDSPSQLWGWQATPMALDVAAVQAMYGANMSYRTGSDTYRLPDSNKLGTSYSCIWDAGGTDRIVGADGRSNTIDLRAATLQVAPGGGGFVSYATGIHGGFTIAKGAVIENATGGSSGDLLRGNGSGNALTGLGGADLIEGLGGSDRLFGGNGADRIRGGSGSDRIYGQGGADLLDGGGGADDFVYGTTAHSGPGSTRDRIVDFVAGVDDIDLRKVDANGAWSGNGTFRFDAGNGFARGEIRQTVTSDGLLLEMNVDGDGAVEMAILLRGLTMALGTQDVLL